MLSQTSKKSVKTAHFASRTDFTPWRLEAALLVNKVNMFMVAYNLLSGGPFAIGIVKKQPAYNKARH